MERVTITIQATANSRFYVARIDGELSEHVGASPDEALGSLVRDAWLSDRLICVTDITHLEYVAIASAVPSGWDSID